MALTPDGSRLFVTNGGAGTVTKINTSTNAVAGTAAVVASTDGAACEGSSTMPTDTRSFTGGLGDECDELL